MTTESIRSSAGSSPEPTADARRRLRQAAGLYLACQALLVFDVPLYGVDVLNDAVGVALVVAALWQVGPLLLGTPRAPLVGAGLVSAAVWLTAVAVGGATSSRTAADAATPLSGMPSLLHSGGASSVVAGVSSAITYLLFAVVLLWATRRQGLRQAAASWWTSARLLAFFYVPLMVASMATAATIALTALQPEHLTEGPPARLVVAVLVVAGLLPWTHTVVSATRTLRALRQAPVGPDVGDV